MKYRLCKILLFLSATFLNISAYLNEIACRIIDKESDNDT